MVKEGVNMSELAELGINCLSFVANYEGISKIAHV